MLALMVLSKLPLVHSRITVNYVEPVGPHRITARIAELFAVEALKQPGSARYLDTPLVLLSSKSRGPRLAISAPDYSLLC